MKKDVLQEKLKELRAAVKQRWGVLTDKDLDTVDAELDKLPGLLQEKYGYTREQAEKEIEMFLTGMKSEGENPVEVVRETLSDSTPKEAAHVEERVYKK
jgi:uncharacterized protein YjbJ (UPF0337 family)